MTAPALARALAAVHGIDRDGNLYDRKGRPLDSGSREQILKASATELADAARYLPADMTITGYAEPPEPAPVTIDDWWPDWARRRSGAAQPVMKAADPGPFLILQMTPEQQRNSH